VTITCPACGKAGQTGANCARCGCDLTRLHATVEAAAAALAEARASLRATDWEAALTWAERSWQLCHSTEAARLAFLAAGALGETASALAWREQVK
jgi:hypothetical protein